jgi:AcrR family transcriptional regulator
VSLRARQKVARQIKILEAARLLFLENGYSKTNMEDIADKAEVGVATIYTYFENKEGVFAQISRLDMSEIMERVDARLEHFPEDPAEAIIELFSIYSKMYDKISMELIRDFIIRAKSPGASRDAVAWLTKIQVGHVVNILETRQSMNIVSNSLDLKTAAKIVIDLLDYHVNRMSSDPEHYKSLKNVNKAIRVLFTNWRAE